MDARKQRRCRPLLSGPADALPTLARVPFRDYRRCRHDRPANVRELCIILQTDTSGVHADTQVLQACRIVGKPTARPVPVVEAFEKRERAQFIQFPKESPSIPSALRRQTACLETVEHRIQRFLVAGCRAQFDISEHEHGGTAPVGFHNAVPTADGDGVLVLSKLSLYRTGRITSDKMAMQNAADSMAYSISTVEARDLNFAAYLNKAMVANEVAIGQAIGMASWAWHWESIGGFLNEYN